MNFVADRPGVKSTGFYASSFRFFRFEGRSMGFEGLVGVCVLLSHFISETTRVGCTVIGLFHA